MRSDGERVQMILSSKNLKNKGPASVGRKDDTFNCKAERSQVAWFLRIADLHSCVPCNKNSFFLIPYFFVCLSW